MSAAVAFREQEGELQVLLIRTSSGKRWGFMKGHAEIGESIEETARREAMEESGHRMLGEGQRSEGFRLGGEGIRVVVFEGAVLVQAGERETAWLPIEKAVAALEAERPAAESKSMVLALRTAAARFRGEKAGRERRRAVFEPKRSGAPSR